ncbi:DUF3219 family protein [Aquibacillus saliphilus]|uniref:DUF3219 family protein n=1 Tax=Aquibacillus saliphilus TaxID=1909422 RepID=UPI001CEFF1D5
MVKEIILNDRMIPVTNYQESVEDELVMISVDFKVSHEEYHEITTLLYKGSFDVNVPEKNVSFFATIQNYFTSITNLYQEGEVGDFHLSLVEMKR